MMEIFVENVYEKLLRTYSAKYQKIILKLGISDFEKQIPKFLFQKNLLNISVKFI